LESIIIFEGLSLGGVESKMPKEEKQKLEMRILSMKRGRLCTANPKPRIAKRKGTNEIIIPKMKPARISPNKINWIETGQDNSRSKVLILASQGIIIGPTEEAVKKRVIPIIPGKRKTGEIFLPKANARNRKNGNIIPKMSTGALK